jgi:hypothetical protein
LEIIPRAKLSGNICDTQPLALEFIPVTSITFHHSTTI